MSDRQQSDTELVRGIDLGDEEAFVVLYRRRQQEVYRFAYAMSKSDSVAQDVVQDVFLNLLQNATRFDPAKGSVRSWLFGCARHLIIDRVRQDRWCSGEGVEEPATPCCAEHEVLAEQRLSRLHMAILNLPTEYREVVALCELGELSYAETAAVVGCPIGTVRSRLHRARAMLAARLTTEAEAEEPRRGLTPASEAYS